MRQKIRAPRLLSWPATVPKPLSAPPLTDAPSDGPAVIAWIEQNCMQGPGDSYGQPVRLLMFQKIFICQLYERKSDGRRRYRRAYLQTAKGQGKTSLAAWIAAYQLAHQFSAEIPICASSYDQAELVFGDLRSTVAQSPTLSDLMTGFEGEVPVCESPSRAFKVPAVAGTADGLRPTTAIFDEVHEFIGPNRERVHLVISNGLSKRVDSLALKLSTPGCDLETVAGRLHQHGLAVNAGEVVDDEFLFVWFGADPAKFDLTDPDGLRAAIRAASPAADAFCTWRMYWIRCEDGSIQIISIGPHDHPPANNRVSNRSCGRRGGDYQRAGSSVLRTVSSAEISTPGHSTRDSLTQLGR